MVIFMPSLLLTSRVLLLLALALSLTLDAHGAHTAAKTRRSTLAESAGSGSSASSAVSPMEKVVELLQKLKGKVQAEGAEEARLYAEFVQWCNSEATESKATIANCEGKLQTLRAQVETEVSTQERLKVETETLVAEISSKEAELAKATEVRKEEKAAFLVADKGFLEGITTFDKALAALSGGGALLQQGMLEQIQDQISVLVQSEAMAGAVSSDHLDNFFQNVAGGMRPASVPPTDGTQTQLALTQQSPMMQELLQMIQQMRGDVVANRKAVQSEEKAKQHSFDLLKQSMELEIKNLQANVEDKKSQAARSRELQSIAQQDIDTTYVLKTDTENYLAETETSCQQKEQENEARQKSRGEELAAIDEALDVLTSERAKEVNSRRSSLAQQQQQQKQQQPPSQQPSSSSQFTTAFLPVGAAGDQSSTNAAVWAPPPLSFLQQRVAASSRTGADPFKKVKDMISGMIVKLMDEAAGAAEKKAWCVEEETKTLTQRKKHERHVEVLSSRIGEMESEIATHQEEVARLSALVKEMDAGAAEATKVRNEEAAAAQAALKDYSDGQNMLQKALQVLSEFYEKKRAAQAAMLLQQRVKAQEAQVEQNEGSDTASSGSTAAAAPPPPATVGGAGAAERQGAATGILGILEVALSDFAQMASEVQTAEATAQREYNEYMQTYALQKAVSLTETKNHAEAKQKTEGMKLETGKDLAMTKSELAAVLQYQEELQKECNFAGPSHEERQARRQAQIGGLQNALAIISGDAVA